MQCYFCIWWRKKTEAVSSSFLCLLTNSLLYLPFTTLQNINNKMKSASFSLPTAAPTASASTAQPPAMQQEEPKRQICFDFTKNQCSRGANCKFSHDLNLIIEVNSQEKGICFDFLKGTCSRGPLCRFFP